MFDIGFIELLVIFILGLIILGPERLPAAARTIGLWVGKIRRTLTNVQMEIEREVRVEEIKRTMDASLNPNLLSGEAGKDEAIPDVLKDVMLPNKDSEAKADPSPVASPSAANPAPSQTSETPTDTSK